MSKRLGECESVSIVLLLQPALFYCTLQLFSTEMFYCLAAKAPKALVCLQAAVIQDFLPSWVEYSRFSCKASLTGLHFHCKSYIIYCVAKWFSQFTKETNIFFALTKSSRKWPRQQMKRNQQKVQSKIVYLPTLPQFGVDNRAQRTQLINMLGDGKFQLQCSTPHGF